MDQTEPGITSDEWLLHQVKQGNEQAFNTLFNRYFDTVFSQAWKRVKDQETAKDIVQEIFTHIWSKRATLHIENLPAYLHVATRNRVLKYMSRQKLTHPFFSALDNIPGNNVSADGRVLYNDFLTAYEAFIEALPPKRREIFRLRFHEGLSTRLISAQMGIERKTVQNQLGKAVEALKSSLLRLLTLLLLLILR